MLSSSSPDFSPRWLRQFFLISLFTVLTACGGGGGSSSTGGGGSSSSSSGGGSSSGGSNHDVQADTFSFTPVADAIPGDTYVSNTVTISGIDTAVPISVTGGEYSLSDGSGEFTAEPGQVSNDQPLTLRVDAPAQTESSAEVTVTVGEGADAVTATYTVTTLKDTTGPEAKIVFPPPMSATDQERIVIRGTAVDDYHTVSDVKLYVDGTAANPIDVDLDSESGEWTANVNLTEGGRHTIKVTATDSEGNITESATEVVLQQQSFEAEFPAGESQRIKHALGLGYDIKRECVVLLGYDTDVAWAEVLTVDLLSGARSVLAAHNVPEGNLAFKGPRSIAIDPAADRFLATSSSGNAVYSGSLDSGEVNILSSATHPSEQPEMDGPRAIAIDPNDSEVAYVTTDFNDKLFKLDLTTGARTVISSNDVESEIDFDSAWGMLINEAGDGAIVVDGPYNDGSSAVFMIDLSTGVRTVVSTTDDQGPFRPVAITSDDIEDRVIVSDRFNGLVAVDLETGVRRQLHEGMSSGFSYVTYSPELDYILWLDRDTAALYAFDLETEGLVTIAKSAP